MRLTVADIKKSFGRKIIFQNIAFELKISESLSISGANGSGKSTLMKTIAGLLTPTSGKVSYVLNEKELDRAGLMRYIGFVSPYLYLYQNLTGYENVGFSLQCKGIAEQPEKVDDLFKFFGIEKAKHEQIKTYSSGMLQRLRFIQALAPNPKVLFLDEPTTTLDQSGKSLLWNYVNGLKNEIIMVIASNDTDDIRQCEQTLCLENFKN
ncbi:MAG: ABC transporter ATP-binding protein [Chlorobiales bacterium]|jgi:heme exporter protein A|nr:ABC transporter ATP-binding protein [Chlorobiales bacterium]